MRLCGFLILLVLVSMPVVAEQKVAGETPAAKTDKQKVPRLKYRNGPVCMCNSGLSEEDIRRAEIKRQQDADKASGSKN